MEGSLTIEGLFKALGGRGELHGLSPNTPFAGVTTDSRGPCKGKVFVALKGEKFNGHRFIHQALEKGAILAISEHPVDAPHLLVNDTLHALHQIATLVRERFSGKVVAITGTNGKTTTKEMLSCILKGHFKVHQNPGNLNNLIGMPLTLANTPPGTEVIVLEMGTNQIGEIATLSQIGRPHVAVITTIGQGHLGPLGGLCGVRMAKMEILKGIEKGGWLVTNADNPQCAGIEFGNRLTFGIEGGEVRAEVLSQGLEGTLFSVSHGGESVKARLKIPGRHHIYNALAAMASAILATGMGLQEAVRGIEDFSPAWGRCACETLKEITILNDAYNSNPDSLAAALHTLASSKANRRVAVIGDMLELGEYAEEAHRQAGRLAAELRIEMLCTYGELARMACQEASRMGMYACSFDSHAEVAEHLSTLLKPGDTVLVKGSRGMRMEEVIRLLKEKCQ